MGSYSTRTLRLAILECDVPIQPVLAARGTYGDIFEKVLDQSVHEHEKRQDGLEIEISKWDVVNGVKYPNMNEIDGLLITGSKHTAYIDEPWIHALIEYLRKVHQESSVKIVGICFGHQIIGRLFGGKPEANPKGWKVAVDEISLTKEGESVFGKQNLKLHQMHRDIVRTVPLGFKALGSNKHCDIQGLYLPGRILSLQAHPEYDEFIMSQLIELRHNNGIFSDELYEEGNMRKSLAHDGLFVMSKILDFLVK